MKKYIVYTIWYHEKGLGPAEKVHYDVKSISQAENVCWYLSASCREKTINEHKF